MQQLSVRLSTCVAPEAGMLFIVGGKISCERCCTTGYSSTFAFSLFVNVQFLLGTGPPAGVYV